MDDQDLMADAWAAALGEHEQAHRTAASALLNSADLFDAQEEANAVRALNVSQD